MIFPTNCAILRKEQLFVTQRTTVSNSVKVGNVYDISINQLHKTVEVKGFPNNRVAAKLVPEYLNDITPQEEYERIQMVRQYGFEKRDRGTGRPTKRERRDIEDFKYK